MGPGTVTRDGIKQPSRFYSHRAQWRTRHLRTHCDQIFLANHEPGHQQIRTPLQEMPSNAGRQSSKKQSSAKNLENSNPQEYENTHGPSGAFNTKPRIQIHPDHHRCLY